MIALGQRFSAAARNRLRGFIWEEDGKPVPARQFGTLCYSQYTARTRPKGYHEIDLRIDLEHSKIAEDLLGAGTTLLEPQSSGHAIHLHRYTWQEPLLAAAQAIGCMVHRTYSTMGMRLG
ncbi:MAG: hypothetical protein ACM3PS_08440 [Syntrophothermus sp.]